MSSASFQDCSFLAAEESQVSFEDSAFMSDLAHRFDQSYRILCCSSLFSVLMVKSQRFSLVVLFFGLIVV